MISPLPPEILQKILCYLDGKTLLSFGQVCEEWNEIINNPTKDLRKVWKDNCHAEIPEDNRLEVLHNLFPKYWLDPSEVRWNLVYSCWHRWNQNCQSLPHSTPDWAPVTVCHQQYEISCTLISGDWILIATRQRGSLIAYNYSTDQKLILYKGADVMDMHLRCTTETFLIDECTDLLPGIAHDVIILNLENKTDAVIDLHTGYTKLVSRLNGLYQLKYFENWEVKVVTTNQETVMNVSNTVAPDEKYFIALGRNLLKVLDVWNGKIVTVARDPNLLRIIMFSYKLNKCRFTINTPVLNNQGRFFYWHANVFVQTSGTVNNHELSIFVGERHTSYFPFQRLSVHIHCVLYYCCTLYLGTDIGILYAYHVPKEEDLLWLDLTRFSWSREVGQEPIISLVIKETEERPFIFVSTMRSVLRLSTT